MAFKLRMTEDMHGIPTHAYFDDLDLGFENVLKSSSLLLLFFNQNV